MQRREGMGKRQPDNIEVAPFDARNVAAGAALNGISPGFVIGLLGRKVARTFVAAEGRKVHERGFHKLASPNLWKADERNAGNHRMRAAGKTLKHASCVIR